MTKNEFFSKEDLGSFTFSDLLKEKSEITRVVTGNGPIAKRVRVIADMVPELFRRYYIHQDSISIIKYAVLGWTCLIFVISLIFPKGSTDEINIDNNGEATVDNKAEVAEAAVQEDEPLVASDGMTVLMVKDDENKENTNLNSNNNAND